MRRALLVGAVALSGCLPKPPVFIGSDDLDAFEPDIEETVDTGAPDPGVELPPEPECETDGDCPAGDSRCFDARCHDGECGFEAKECDDDNPCTISGCDDAIGCVQTASSDEPCDDGDPCTVDDRCETGTCVGGLSRPFERLVDPVEDDGEEQVVAATPNGQGGWLLGSTQDAPGNGSNMVARSITADGETGWLVVVDRSGAQETSDVAVLPQGPVAVGTQVKPGAARGILVCLDTGQPDESQGTMAFPGLDRAAFHGATVQGETLLLAGETHPPGEPKFAVGWFLRVRVQDWATCAWEVVGSDEYGGGGLNNGDHDHLVDVAPLDDEGWALLGRTVSRGVGGYDTWLIRVDHNGNVLWQTDHGGPKADLAQRLVALEGGLLVGATGTGTKSTGAPQTDITLSLFKPESGAHLWSRSYGGEHDETLTDLTAIDGGDTLLIATQQDDSDTEHAQAIRVRADGAVRWERVVERDDSPGTQVELATVHAADDDAVIFGRLAFEQPHPWMIHMDSWGNLGCDVAGPCAGLTVAEADDLDPCTDPWCDPESVPPSGTTANTAWCDDADACTVLDRCTAGACTSGPARLLFDERYPPGLVHSAERLLPMPDGGWILGGVRQLTEAVVPSTWLARTNRAGVLVWQWTSVGGFADVTDLKNGSLAVLGAAGEIAILSVDGHLLTERTATLLPGDVPVAVRRVHDGGLAVVGTRGSGGFVLRLGANGEPVTGGENTFGDVGVPTVVHAVEADGLGWRIVGASGTGDVQGWIARTDVNGVGLDSVSWGGKGEERFDSAVDAPGGLILAVGTSTSNTIESDRPLLAVFTDELIPVEDQPLPFDVLAWDGHRALGIAPVEDGWLVWGQRDGLPTHLSSDGWIARLTAGLAVSQSCIVGLLDVDEVSSSLLAEPEGGFTLAGLAISDAGQHPWLVRADADCITTCP